MTEEELEDSVTPELLPSKDLAVIIKETGLEESLAQEFTSNFQEHFRMAAEWAKKAKKIIVTDPSQVVVMQEARTARLFLREKRLEIEKFRVARKEYFLKGGRAIDKVANFLKDTIIPIEEHLDRQEHFVEIRKKAEDDRILAEAYAKQEAERLAKEEADRQALAKANEENARLRKEAEAKAKAQQAELDKIRKEKEAELAQVRAVAQKAEDELKLNRQAEEKEKAKAEADRIREEERQSKLGENDYMLILKNHLEKTPYPEVRSIANKRIISDVKSYVGLAILKIEILEDET